MQSRVIVSGEPLLVNDVPEQVKDAGRRLLRRRPRRADARSSRTTGPPGVQAAMMLPVKHEGQVVGVVQLMHATRPTYDDEQLELAEGLVGLMAAAVRNARLHEEAPAEAAARRARARRRRPSGSRPRGCWRRSARASSWSTTTGVVRFWNRAAELRQRRATATRCSGVPLAEIFADWEAIAAGSRSRTRARRRAR